MLMIISRSADIVITGLISRAVFLIALCISGFIKPLWSLLDPFNPSLESQMY